MLIPRENKDMFKEDNPEKPIFLSRLQNFYRNKLFLYQVGDKRVLLKKFEKSISFRRELFFYNLFNTTNLIRTPKIYSCGMSGLATYIIESNEKVDFLSSVGEWAKIHSYFLDNLPKDKKLMFEHNFCEIKDYILKNISLFGKKGKELKKYLSKQEISKNLRTLIHADLQNKNTTTRFGNNYYFDFEISGVGHPLRDLATIISCNLNHKEEIINTYRENILFDYPEIEADLQKWIVTRNSQLILILNRGIFPKRKRQQISNGLWKAINNSLI